MIDIRRIWILWPITIALTALSTEAAWAREARLSSCLGHQAFAGPLERIIEARSRLTEGGWREACRQARDAEQRRQKLMAQLLSPNPVSIPAYKSAARFAHLAMNEHDPERKELFTRVYKDQFARESLSREARAHFADNLNATTYMLLSGKISAEAVRIDKDNQNWLSATIGRRGWFTISRDGVDADAAAWLLAQHADSDPEFQLTVIRTLEPLVALGETSGPHFANLYDRWAATNRRPLKYGIRGECVGSNDWQPLRIEDPEQVDQRRTKVGLNRTLAEEIAEKSKRCSPRPSTPPR